jgi:Ser/Thr protein kinase RdoA (MazF antagonist)
MVLMMNGERNSFHQVQAEIAEAFTVRDSLSLLAGGEGRTYRAGDTVYRRETNVVEATFVADLYDNLDEQAFRVPKPQRTQQGAWVSARGWSAWSFVAGRPTTVTELPHVITALEAFHHALAPTARPGYLVHRDGPFDRADRAAWGTVPTTIDARLMLLVAALVNARRMDVHLPEQLIHGDLNEENILVAPGMAPAIIDMTPYWRPAAFALAVLAYWLGPYQGDMAILPLFAHVPAFPQMLVRVGLRTLLIVHEFGQLGGNVEDSAHEFAPSIQRMLEWLPHADTP